MKVNISLEDVSPLLLYSLNWTQTPLTEPCINQYSGWSLTTTSSDGAWMMFNFTGTGVWVFGATRQDHGNFTVSLDGGIPEMYTSHGADPDCDPIYYQLSIYSQQNLTMGPHSLVLTNRVVNSSQNVLDIDFVIFETEVNTEQGSSRLMFDDTDTSFTYYPSQSAWSTARSSQLLYLNETVHQSDSGETVFTFNGDAVSIFGGLDPNYGTFTATLDGNESSVQSLNANGTYFWARSLIYHKNSLGSGQHNLLLSPSGGGCDIDYAYVYGASPLGVYGASPSEAAQCSAPGGPSLALILGPTLGAIVLVGIIMGLLLCWLLRLRRRSQTKIDLVSNIADSVYVLPDPYTDYQYSAASANTLGESGVVSAPSNTLDSAYTSSGKH